MHFIGWLRIGLGFALLSVMIGSIASAHPSKASITMSGEEAKAVCVAERDFDTALASDNHRLANLIVTVDSNAKKYYVTFQYGASPPKFEIGGVKYVIDKSSMKIVERINIE
jgi:hypothetical protein